MMFSGWNKAKRFTQVRSNLNFGVDFVSKNIKIFLVFCPWVHISSCCKVRIFAPGRLWLYFLFIRAVYSLSLTHTHTLSLSLSLTHSHAGALAHTHSQTHAFSLSLDWPSAFAKESFERRSKFFWVRITFLPMIRQAFAMPQQLAFLCKMLIVLSL